ncbi:hypothetical protein EVAR_75081_1 [Eumeta japonica]|uniref:Uncharacterized protein n=1 Tax=Eumeta variegata TaxID=151549 RepID=A0A4C1W362_EUMVA|nr:hypothetical protein EVAR_75081_1 [Eumeta japonica]
MYYDVVDIGTKTRVYFNCKRCQKRNLESDPVRGAKPRVKKRLGSTPVLGTTWGGNGTGTDTGIEIGTQSGVVIGRGRKTGIEAESGTWRKLGATPGLGYVSWQYARELCVASLRWFEIFKDGNLNDLKGYECGQTLDKQSVKCLLCVDDQVILVPSMYKLQEMETKMNDSVQKTRMKINMKKRLAAVGFELIPPQRLVS